MTTTKKDIILSLLSLAEEKGLANVSLSDIALNVGIQKSSIYRHFESQKAIIDYTILFCQTELEKKVSIVDSKLNFKAKDVQSFLYSLLDNLLETFTETPLCSYLCIIEQQRLFNKAFRALHNKVYSMIVTRVRVALEFCVQKSWLSINDTDAASDLFASSLMQSIIEVILNDNSDWDLENLVSGLITLFS